MKICVYILTKKTTSFYDWKKCKACCHVLSIPLKDQKPTIMLFGGDGTHCFERKTSRDFDKKNLLQFWRYFSANQIQAHPNLNRKRQQLFHLWYNRVQPHWLIQLTKTSFTSSFYTLSVYIKAAWFSQSPTTVLSGLSTLYQIQWLWM